MSKAKAETIHARNRARERFGIELGPASIAEIVDMIQSGKATVLHKQSLSRTVFAVEYEGIVRVVVYDKTRKTLVTFLTEDQWKAHMRANGKTPPEGSLFQPVDTKKAKPATYGPFYSHEWDRFLRETAHLRKRRKEIMNRTGPSRRDRRDQVEGEWKSIFIKHAQLIMTGEQLAKVRECVAGEMQAKRDAIESEFAEADEKNAQLFAEMEREEAAIWNAIVSDAQKPDSTNAG